MSPFEAEMRRLIAQGAVFQDNGGLNILVLVDGEIVTRVPYRRFVDLKSAGLVTLDKTSPLMGKVYTGAI